MSKTSQALSLYESVAKGVLGRQPVVEFIGDNTTDNLVQEVDRSAQVELEQFVCGLLNGSAELFQYAFMTPQYQPFAEAMEALSRRYAIMDGMEKGDVELKVKASLSRIFSEKYGALGPEIADQMAAAYAAQFVSYLKAKTPQIADLTLSQDGKTF